MQNKLNSFAFTSLMVAFAAILFCFAKLSPLKDGTLYFLLLLIESLVILEFGFKMAFEYYIVTSILALLILQIPFCFSYIFIVGTWPLIKFYLQLKIPDKRQAILRLLIKSLFYIAYAALSILGIIYFNQLTVQDVLNKLKGPLANFPVLENVNLTLILVLLCLTGHVIDYLLDRCIYYYMQYWQDTLHKAFKLR